MSSGSSAVGLWALSSWVPESAGRASLITESRDSDARFFLSLWLMRFSRRHNRIVPPKAANKGMPIPRPIPRPTPKPWVLLAVAMALADPGGWDGQPGIEVPKLDEFAIVVDWLEIELVMGVFCTALVGTRVDSPKASPDPFCIIPNYRSLNRGMLSWQ